MVNRILRVTQVPPDILAIRAHATKFFDASLPHSRGFGLAEKLTELRANILSGALSDSTSICVSALKLDKDFSDLSDLMRSQWAFKSLRIAPDNPLFYSGFYHYYLNDFGFHVWNMVRVWRI